MGSWEGKWGEKVVLGNVENMFGLGKMTNNAKGSITEAMDLCTKLEKITSRTFVLNWKKLLIGPLY